MRYMIGVSTLGFVKVGEKTLREEPVLDFLSYQPTMDSGIDALIEAMEDPKNKGERLAMIDTFDVGTVALDGLGEPLEEPLKAAVKRRIKKGFEGFAEIKRQLELEAEACSCDSCVARRSALQSSRT